jgi:glycosyltransferase involved in cell wall biosynthesis
VTVFQRGQKLADTRYNAVTIHGESVCKFTQSVLSQLDKTTDIVIPTNGGWQSFLCKVWTLQNGKKLIISGQAGIGRDDRINLWCFPDTFVALTKYQDNWAKNVNPFVKTAVIPNGADITVFASEKEKYEFNLPKPIILSVGALVPIKRHQLEIEAVSKLEKGSLVLVGKGELQDDLQKMGDELLPGRFRIMNVTHTEMPNVYKGADLFTFATSPWESFGIVLVEAMSSGLPIVASDDPIRREIVGEAGLFVDPINATAYASAIESALSTDWGDKPMNQSKNFVWSEISKKYEKLFVSMIEK